MYKEYERKRHQFLYLKILLLLFWWNSFIPSRNLDTYVCTCNTIYLVSLEVGPILRDPCV